ncbi:MAG: sigma-70 family RNA polymerase sigma factor [Phycisphaerales bacterium]|nr:sigma-70 family RNA polymerase sigma factor [Phycisphaerales bacterium]
MDKQTPKSELVETDEVIKQLRRADRTQLGRFVRHHGVWMLAVSKRILQDEGHAEDAVQNAFASIFRNLETFEGGSSLKTWMHRIQINEALMLLRKRKRRKEESIDDLLPEFDAGDCRVMDEWTSERSPESLMQVTQFQEAVADLIDQLPDNYRVVLLLRDIEELSTAEVAQMLEMSEANVKVRLHRARAALKKLLEPLMREESL